MKRHAFGLAVLMVVSGSAYGQDSSQPSTNNTNSTATETTTTSTPATPPAAPSTTAAPAASASTTSTTATAESTVSKNPRLDWFRKKFKGSMLDLSTFIGSGSFHTSGYTRPYVAEALYLRPRYNIGTKANLSLNGRVYLLYEFTSPETENGRRFSAYDIWLWLTGSYKEPRSKINISGTLRLMLPTSHESIYSNMILGVGLGPSLSRKFEWGNNKNWNAHVSLGAIASKTFHTHWYRGNGPGDSAGCRSNLAPLATAAAFGEGAPAIAPTDTCGGPLNTSWTVVTSTSLGVGWKKLSLDVTLLFINSFKYSFPRDQYTAANAVDTGRSDATWGIITLAYQFHDHFGVSLGLSSYQPALSADYTRVRFPFFDFESGNAANYTSVFLGVNGTL